MAIIMSLDGAPDGRTLTEISRAVDLNKATTYRLLQTMVEDAFVHFDERTSRYSIGRALIQLRVQSDGSEYLRRLALPYMTRLRDSTKETVSLVIPRGHERQTIEVVLGLHELKVVPDVGSTKPIYAGAAGKVMLAFLDADELTRLVADTHLAPATSATITSEEVLRDELKRIRRVGYATSIGESILGEAAVAAPIFGHQGRVIASLNVFGPDARLPQTALTRFARETRELAKQISADLAPAVKNTGTTLQTSR